MRHKGPVARVEEFVCGAGLSGRGLEACGFRVKAVLVEKGAEIRDCDETEAAMRRGMCRWASKEV